MPYRYVPVRGLFNNSPLQFGVTRLITGGSGNGVNKCHPTTTAVMLSLSQAATGKREEIN